MASNTLDPSSRNNVAAIRWLTYLMFFMFAMTTDAVGVIIPKVIAEFKLNQTTAGALHYGSMAGIMSAGLLLGFLADAAVNPAIATTFTRDGAVVSLAGSAGQFLNQLIGVGFTILFSGVATLLILWVVGLITPLRVSREEEDTGLDISEHGESAYND